MKRFLILGIMLVGLAACGGGGSGSGGTTNTTSQDYAIYLSATATGTSLKAYDPNTGKSQTITTTKPSYEAGIMDGTIDPTTLTTTKLHLSDVLFIENNKIESVSTAASNNLAVTQLSNYSGKICNHTLYNNYLTITDAGLDGTCSTPDDAYYAVTTKMASTASPITLPADPFRILFSDYTTAVGMLYVNLGTLYFADANGQNPYVVSSVASVTPMDHVGSSVLLNIDGSIKVFDDKTSPPTLSSPLYTPSTNPVSAINDGKNYYFLDNGVLYKVPVDGSANATPITTVASVNGNNLLFIHNNYLVFTNNSTNGETLNCVNLNLTSPGILKLASGPTTSLNVVGFGGNYLYYNINTTSGQNVTGYTAYAQTIDGLSAPQIFTVSQWYGSTRTTTVAAGSGMYKSLAYVVLNAFTTDISGNVTGASISVYDAATDTLASDQGSLPTNVLGFTGTGFGTDFYGEFIDMSTSSAYLARLSTTTANSMQQIDTSTTAVQDGIIF